MDAGLHSAQRFVVLEVENVLNLCYNQQRACSLSVACIACPFLRVSEEYDSEPTCGCGGVLYKHT